MKGKEVLGGFARHGVFGSEFDQLTGYNNSLFCSRFCSVWQCNFTTYFTLHNFLAITQGGFQYIGKGNIPARATGFFRGKRHKLFTEIVRKPQSEILLSHLQCMVSKTCKFVLRYCIGTRFTLKCTTFSVKFFHIFINMHDIEKTIEHLKSKNISVAYRRSPGSGASAYRLTAAYRLRVGVLRAPLRSGASSCLLALNPSHPLRKGTYRTARPW